MTKTTTYHGDCLDCFVERNLKTGPCWTRRIALFLHTLLIVVGLASMYGIIKLNGHLKQQHLEERYRNLEQELEHNHSR